MKDLHIHTKYSDGEYDEYQILEKIKTSGIDEFAICDHDTTEGSEKVFSLLVNESSGLKFHSGVELTSRVNGALGGVNVHLLVRDFNFNDRNVNYLINKASSLRKEKVMRMAYYIASAFGIKFTDKELFDVMQSTNTVGKPHMYKLLSKHITIEREQFYRRMDGLVTNDLRLDALEVLSLVSRGNGNVTLAHPKEIMREYKLGYEDIDFLANYLKSYGLYGIETKHSLHTKEDYLSFHKIAQKYDLVESCGSDFHGEHVKPNVFLGVCEKQETLNF